MGRVRSGLTPGGDGAAARSRAAEGPKGTGAGQKYLLQISVDAPAPGTTNQPHPPPPREAKRSASPVSSHHFPFLLRTSTATLDRSSQPDRPAGRPPRAQPPRKTDSARTTRASACPASRAWPGCAAARVTTTGAGPACVGRRGPWGSVADLALVFPRTDGRTRTEERRGEESRSSLMEPRWRSLSN